MKLGVKGGVFIFLVLLYFNVNAQTKGLIIKPATGTGASVLDPNGDGYSSETNQGFINNDYEFDETEIDFNTLVRPDPIGDPIVGPSGMFNDIVGVEGSGEHAVFTYIDGSENFLVRFRLDGYAPNSKSYALFIDTDQKFGFTGPDADPDATTDNPGFELEISLHTNFEVTVYNIDNGSSVLLHAPNAYPYDSYCQKSIAYTMNSGDPDFFYDYFVPLSVTGLTSSTPIRAVGVTTMNPNQAIGNNALSDVGGDNTDDDLTQTFIELITGQTPTVPGEEVLDRTECPTITAPISTGETTVAGTCENGALIEVFVNDASQGTTWASGTLWSKTVSALNYGDVVTATATISGEGTSESSCNTTIVGSDCTETPSVTTLDNGDKGISITNAAIFNTGTVFTIYDADTDLEWVGNKADNNPHTLSTADSIAGSFSIGCNNQGNCMNDGSYYVIAEDPSLCPSSPVYFCVGTAISSTSAPSIDAIMPYSSVVTGTGGLMDATLYLYANGTQIAFKTLSSSGAWSINVNPEDICNTTITAQQVESGLCISAVSTGVTVGQNVTSPPIVYIDECTTSISLIEGFSGESDGTAIEVFVNGSSVGSTTVNNNYWSLSYSVSTNLPITASATNSSECKSTSPASDAVTLVGTTSTSGITFTITSDVYEGASSVPVNYSGVSGASTIYLYIDGDQIGSASISSGSGTANISPVYSSDIYAGGYLYVSLQTGTACESSLYDLSTTVLCNPPTVFDISLGVTETPICVDESGEITLSTSESLVIYTPVNSSGTEVGYSTLGTGSGITLTTHPVSSSGDSYFYIKAEKFISSGTCDSTSTAYATITATEAPNITADPDNVTVCYGSGTSFYAAWSGTGPYDIQWQVNTGTGYNNLINTSPYSGAVVSGTTATGSTLSINSATGLGGYLYRCIVTDTGVGSNCQKDTSSAATLTLVTVSLSGIVTNATSGDNGEIDVSVTGGDGNYSYDWNHLNPPSPSYGEESDLTGLSAGSYTLTVMDGNGCTDEETFNVAGEGSINLTLDDYTHVTCFGADDGTITVSASDGTAPYTYSYDDFATSNTTGYFTGLAPGNYVIEAIDDNSSESNTVNVTITQPVEIIVYSVVSNETFPDEDDGQINIAIYGGTSPFSFSWTSGTYPSFSASTEDISGLQAGIYYLEVTDDNGCTAYDTLMVYEPSISSNPCDYYFYDTYDDGNYYEDSGNLDFYNNWSMSGSFYRFEDYVLKMGVIPNYQSGPATTITLTTLTRQGDMTGSLNDTISFVWSITGQTNQDNYTLNFNVNSTTEWSLNVDGNVSPTSGTITLTSADYTQIDGINTFSFSISGSGKSYVNIDNFKVSFQKNFTIGIIESPSTCDNGEIDISVEGAFEPYSYSWSTSTGGTGLDEDGSDQTGLSDGTYSVTVTDSVGCELSYADIVIDDMPLSVSGSGSNPTCVGGGSNGSATATLTETGGGGPYIYTLTELPSTVSDTDTTAYTSHTFTGLGVANYTIAVADANGCTANTGSISLTLPTYSAELSVNGSTTICNGDTTTLVIIISGEGTSPYVVTLNTGKKITGYISGTPIQVWPSSSTTYSISSIVDAASCQCGSNTGSGTITVNPKPSATVSGGGEICSGESTTISIDLAGTAPWDLTYAINGIDQTPVNTSSDPYVITTSAAGTYTVTALSDAYCTGSSFSGSAVVTVNSLPVVSIDSYQHPSCAADLDGYINISVTGNGGYSYSWILGSAPFSTSQNLSSLGEGYYEVTVTDINSCQGSNNITLSYDDNEAPAFTSCPSNYSISTNGTTCKGNLNPDEPVATDNCGSAGLTWEMVQPISGTTTGSTSIGNTSFDEGITTITYTATDVSGNTEECIFTVTVSDQTSPTALCINDTLYLDGSGDASLSAADIDNGSYDDCSATPTLQISFDDVNYYNTLDFDCSNLTGNTTVYLRVTDGGGYADGCTALVTVYDTLQPTLTVLQDTISEILYSGTDSTFTIPYPTISDNCSSDTVFTVASVSTSPVNYTYSLGETWVYWSSTDDYGYSSLDSQLVVLASMGGIGITCPDNDTLGCITTLPGTNPYSASYTTTSPWVLMSTSNDWPGVGTGNNCDSVHTVTYSASWQVHGKGAVKTLTCQQMIHFRVDTINPSISCRTDTTVNINTNPCSYTVPDNRMDAIAYSDNCAIDSIYNDFNNTNTLSGDQIPAGANTIRWIVVDSCGNRDTCNFVLTVRNIQAEVTRQSDDNDCPQLEADQGFNPNNEPSIYDLGTTEVVFRVERLYSIANPWSFDFNINGTNVTVEDATPAPSSGDDDNGTYSGITDDWIDITFLISNIEETELIVTLNVTSISDNNNCEDTTTRSAQVTILAMPAVGPFE